MKYVSSFRIFCALALTLLANQASAGNWQWGDWSNPNAGFVISTQAENGPVFKSGDQVTFTCGIDWVSGSNGKSIARPNKLDDVDVSFYWPDLSHDVTAQVQFSRSNFTCAYKTPALNAGDLNQFTVVVGSPTLITRNLQTISAKLQKRITVLSKHISNPQIADLVSRLQNILARVNGIINAKMEELAENRTVLIVDNQLPTASSRNMSLIGGFVLDETLVFGANVAGGSSLANVIVSDFRQLFPGIDFGYGSKPIWTVQSFFNGELEKDSGEISFPSGSSVTQSFTVSDLEAGVPQLVAELTRENKKDKIKDKAALSLTLPVAADNVAPVITVSSPLASTDSRTLAPINATIADALGLIDPTSIKVTLNGTLASGGSFSGDVSSLAIAQVGQGQSYTIAGDLNPIPEGTFVLTFNGSDLAGDAATPTQIPFQIDRTAPSIALGVNDHVLTNQPNFQVPVTVTDASSTTTTILQNGVQVYQTTEAVFTATVALTEGLNIIEVDSIDAAGNAATPVVLSDVTLDNTPPMLSNIQPQDGSTLGSLSFTVSGTSNKPLSGVMVNGLPATLSQDALSFTYAYTAPVQGSQSITIQASDLAGNTSSQTIGVTITLHVLNGSLVSIIPDVDGKHLDVIGAPGAVNVPGVTVNASAGFFNSGTAIAGSDGSFKIPLNVFQSVTVTVLTDSVTLAYNVTTTLAGRVLDNNSNPLPGATVTIVGTTLSVVTDSAGTFLFNQPMTGNQVIQVDGSTIPVSVTGPNRKFYKNSVSLSIGLTQNNVLPHPIYLIPSILDGTETTVSAGGAASITSPHAPGVTLDLQAGVITFPDGTNSGTITMQTIPASVSTIPTPGFAQPLNIINLQPSGTMFSEPVTLTVPNTNNIPAGVDVLFLSENTTKGIWEIGAAGTVTQDGQSIQTKDGMGIRHFSSLYISPLGPKVSQVGAQDVPGANTFDGSLSSSISMPSYKALGQDVSPSLVYKSSWAHPTVLVSNLFNIPRQDIYLTWSETSGNWLYSSSESLSVHSWIEPDYILASFNSAALKTDPVNGGSGNPPMKFTGLPNNSVVSYAMDLIDPTTSQYFPSGIYPYDSHYEVHLQEITVATVSSSTGGVFGLGIGIVFGLWNSNTSTEAQQIAQAFPSDLQGQIFVTNQVNSPAGSGWRISGYQQIKNPTQDRIYMEEADGSVASYAINNTISTLFNGNGTNVDLTQGVDLSNWPNAAVTENQSDPVQIATMDLSSQTPTPSVASTLYTLAAKTGFWANDYNLGCGWSLDGATWYGHTQQLLTLPGGQIMGTDSYRGEVFQTLGSSSSLLAGNTAPGPVFTGISSPNQEFNALYFTPGLIDVVHLQGYQAGYYGCPLPDTSSGQWAYQGFDSTNNTLTTQLNAPMGIVAGLQANTLVIADTGNNIVRSLNLTTQTVSTIAGNGQTYDNGDGGPATSASLYQPRGVVYDSAGNLYISTLNGYVRKVDTLGNISTIAGLSAANGGVLAETGIATTLTLNSPTGLVIDNNQNILYVADTGNQVVRAIDLTSLNSKVVAGNFSSGPAQDGIPALNASLSMPTWLGLDNAGNLIIDDSGHNRLRRVIFQNQATGVLTFAPTSQDHSLLTRNADGSLTRSYRNGNVVSFTAQGLELSANDRVGRLSQYNYDGLGRVTSMIDPTGQTTQYIYSGANLSTIIDPAGRQTNFYYTGSFLTQVTFPDGTIRSYTYNAAGQLASETNQRGFTTQYLYNVWNRLYQVIRADNSVVTVNDSGSGTAGNNFVGGAAGTLQSFGTTPGSANDGITDAKGTTTTFAKDPSTGYITTIVDGANETTTIARNLIGEPTLITRPDNSTVSFVYDPNTNDLLSQTDTATGITSSQTYDAYGNLLTSTNGRGYTSTSTYDPNTGVLLSKTDPLGNTSSYSGFNSFGEPTAFTNALGKTSTSAFDAFGNVVQTKDALGNTTTMIRDTAGNVVQTTNALTQVSKYTFDSFNRLTSVITPKGEKTVYSYLATGDLSQIKDALGNTASFQYDPLDRLSSKTDVLGFTTSRSYDANGNVVLEVDPNGNHKQFVYDSLNRLTRKLLPDNTVGLTYDTRSNLLFAQNNQSFVHFTYDVASRLTSSQTLGLGPYASLPGIIVSYGYDADNNRVSMQEVTGQTNYVYDQADRLTQLTNPKGETYSFGYDSGNRLTSMNRPGISTTLSFDDRNFVTSIVHANSGGTLSSFAYTMDGIGNRTQMTNTVGSFNYGYDADNQITSASNPEISGGTNASYSAETFGYDPISNRTADQNGSFTFDAKSQRLQQDYKYFYYWDNNGNMISKQSKADLSTTNYSYSSENQLVKIQFYAAGSTTPYKTATYAYDATGRRIAKDVVDSTAPSDPTKTFSRRYVYDGQEILMDFDGSGNLLARYTHSSLRTDDVLAANITSSGVTAGLAQSTGTYEYVKDAQGTVTDVTDTTGNKIQHYLYSAFGMLLGIQDAMANDITPMPKVATSYTFTGREFDQESGLYFYRARVYDPGTGRFLQADSSPGHLSIPASVVNSYAYVANNPTNMLDASGRTPWAEIGFVGLFAVSLLFPPAGILTAVVWGAALGATGSLALVEATKYGGNFNNLVAGEGAGGVLRIAGIGAVAGGVGAWAGPGLAGAITGNSSGTAFTVLSNGFEEAISSGASTGGLILSGDVQGGPEQVAYATVFGFGLGAGLGALKVNTGWQFRDPALFFYKGGFFMLFNYNLQPQQDNPQGQ